MLALLMSLPAAAQLAAGVVTGPAPMGSDSLAIRLEHDTEAERRTRTQLERIVRENDIERWIETREIVIDESTIPHSHPVLTLHTRHLGDDDALLSTFLHEQFHWYADRAGARADSAMAEFRRLFPEAPADPPEGAGSAESTYLHLVVCDLELQAMTVLKGRERAGEVLSRINHYRWVYRSVLTDPRIREVNRRHGLMIR